jgi:predicted RNase H-like HicB family nuclease
VDRRGAGPQALATHGDTPEQAISELRTAMELWLEVAREEGWPLPEPRFRAPAAAE